MASYHTTRRSRPGVMDNNNNIITISSARFDVDRYIIRLNLLNVVNCVDLETESWTERLKANEGGGAMKGRGEKKRNT